MPSGVSAAALTEMNAMRRGTETPMVFWYWRTPPTSSIMSNIARRPRLSVMPPSTNWA